MNVQLPKPMNLLDSAISIKNEAKVVAERADALEDRIQNDLTKICLAARNALTVQSGSIFAPNRRSVFHSSEMRSRIDDPKNDFTLVGSCFTYCLNIDDLVLDCISDHMKQELFPETKFSERIRLRERNERLIFASFIDVLKNSGTADINIPDPISISLADMQTTLEHFDLVAEYRAYATGVYCANRAYHAGHYDPNELRQSYLNLALDRYNSDKIMLGEYYAMGANAGDNLKRQGLKKLDGNFACKAYLSFDFHNVRQHFSFSLLNYPIFRTDEKDIDLNQFAQDLPELIKEKFTWRESSVISKKSLMAL